MAEVPSMLTGTLTPAQVNGLGWRRTYARLIKNRLLMYTSGEHDAPFLVWPLAGDVSDLSGTGMVKASQMPDKDLDLLLAFRWDREKDKERTHLHTRVVVRFDSYSDKEKWTKAIREEKNFEQVRGSCTGMASHRAHNTRSRWFHVC
jgi:hypothetical protein